MSASPYEEPNINPGTDQQQQQFMDNNDNNTNPNDFSYPDDADEDVDDEIRAHRQQQMLANDPREAGVEHVNFLLEILSMKAERPVLRLSQLSSSFFVLAFKQLFGDVPEGVNISPQTIDDRINNARVVIESIESKLDMSLAHISPELVATHDELHIAKLLRVFVDIVTPSEGEMMGLAGDDTRGGDEDEEGDERSTNVDDHHQQQHQLFSQLHSVNAQYGGSTSKQSATPQQQQQQRSGQQQQAGHKKQQQQQPAAASGVRPQPQVMVRDWLTGLYSHGSYEKQQPDSFESQLHEGDHHHHQQQDGAEQQNNENISSNNNQQQQQNTNNMDPTQYAFNNSNQQHPPLYQQQFDGIKQHQQQQDGYNNNNMMMNDPTTANYDGQQYYQNSNNNQQNMMPVGGGDPDQHQHLSSTIAEARRVRRVADFIERSNIPRYQTQLCKRLSDNDGRYIRQFTGDGPLSTIGVASMQKQSTTNNASMARRPLPAMTNARRDAKIEKLRAEKFLQDAQDRAVREVVRQASREEVRMVKELKQQLAEQRQTFLSLDKLAKEKDQRLRQIYNDNVISSVGAAKNKGVKLNLHKNAADLVRREREVVEREKQECESEIRLQFEVLRAKRESYLSHLSSWRVAVMKQQDATTTAPVPTSSRQQQKTGGSSKKQQQQLHSATSSARQSQQQHPHHVDPHSSYQQQPTAVVA